MCGLDNWKGMQIHRGLLRFTGSSFVFPSPWFPFYIKCLVYSSTWTQHPWKLSSEFTRDNNEEKTNTGNFEMKNVFSFSCQRVKCLFLFLPKLILMFAYVKLLRVKSKGAIWQNVTHVDIKNCNLTGKQQQQPSVSFILSAELTLTFWFSFFFPHLPFISPFLYLLLPTHLSLQPCVFLLISSPVSCHSTWFSLAQLPAPVRSPRLYVAMQCSVAYKHPSAWLLFEHWGGRGVLL